MEAAMGASLVTIAVATIASWIFGAVYYGTLSKPWMAAANMTEEDVKGPNGKPSPRPYIVSIVCEFVMAYLLAVLLLHTSDGIFTLGTALFSAFLIWFGFIFTTQLVNHQYSIRPFSLTIIDSGHWLGVLLIQAIVMALMGL
ncbi:MAG: DUF1761 domain-containing protein [Salaquimonas sp.]